MAVVVMVGDVYGERGIELVEGEILKVGSCSNIMILPGGLCKGRSCGSYYRATSYIPVLNSIMWEFVFGFRDSSTIRDRMAGLGVVASGIKNKEIAFDILLCILT